MGRALNEIKMCINSDVCCYPQSFVIYLALSTMWNEFAILLMVLN